MPSSSEDLHHVYSVPLPQKVRQSQAPGLGYEPLWETIILPAIVPWFVAKYGGVPAFPMTRCAALIMPHASTMSPHISAVCFWVSS